MTNRGGSGCCCCSSQDEAKADEQAVTTTKHEKGGCGCEGEGRKAEIHGMEPAVAQAAIAEPTRPNRKQGCC